MFTTFMLLAAAGLGFRLALAWGLRKHYDRRLAIPDLFALVLLVLAGLPDWLSPLSFPFPFSFTLGTVLPDLLMRRL
ncbi:hypothetical protein SAMN06265373_1194 [Shimia sagamensis]|uniref:Branched-chain amino acid transport protein (AzlD) n=1 Tax=Shimia sagamensis TaxID=1566352 RepID=A0ABY1PLQ1_9RHOB|nr:hypothetical protein SAMN06265373_1194 [Shimia sagamensis]